MEYTAAAMASSPDPCSLDTEERAWLGQVLSSQWRAEPDALDVRPVPSRTGNVFHVSSGTGDERRAAFVKRCGPPEFFASRADYFDALRRVMAVVAADGAFARLDILGADADRGLLMTAPMSGRTLASVISRGGALAGLLRPPAPLGATFADLARYLAVLHTVDRRPAAGHAHAIGVYTTARFAAWGEADPDRSATARRAIARVDELVAGLAGREPPVVLCHGDVTPQNVLLGPRLGLIDWDDLRWDFPASDLSQVVLGIGHLAWWQRAFAGRERQTQIASAFRSAYGTWPNGAEWELPHMRNLAVYLFTLATRRTVEHGWARRQTEGQYRYLLDTLAATIDVDRTPR